VASPAGHAFFAFHQIRPYNEAQSKQPGGEATMTGGIRPGEKAVAAAPPGDAALIFIGHIVTPWMQRKECPHQGSWDGPLCQLVIDPVWAEALTGIETFTHLQVLYWMDQARRDLVLLAPSGGEKLSGPFALRAPTRPNPIASSIVRLVERQDNVLLVRGLDCVSGTPLLDIKAHRGAAQDGATANVSSHSLDERTAQAQSGHI
jgi:tRNA-Thr(GGU) m(6)t(6)A37 methyltransferase TsaA